MTVKPISELIEYIETKGKELGGDYADYEMLAIQILDSSFEDYRSGELEAELKNYLQKKWRELCGKSEG